MDHRNRVCDCQKALLNGHHDRQYLDVTTYFTNFNSSTTFTTTLPCFKIKNQFYDGSVAQATRIMEMVINNLTS